MEQLPQTPEIVLRQVAKKIVPSTQEEEKMVGLSQAIQREVEDVLASSGIEAKVSPQGSSREALGSATKLIWTSSLVSLVRWRGKSGWRRFSQLCANISRVIE